MKLQTPEGKTRKTIFAASQRIGGEALIWLYHCVELLPTDYFTLFISETQSGGFGAAIAFAETRYRVKENGTRKRKVMQ